MALSAYPTFREDCTSLLKKYLTPALFEKLRSLETTNNFTLERAIRSGVIHQDSNIGIYAGDAESYQLFRELFNPIIEDYHGFRDQDRHFSDFEADPRDIKNPDPGRHHILSTRIRVARNLSGFPLGPAINREQRRAMTQKIVRVLLSLEGQLTGRYYPLENMGEADRRRLVEDHFLFKQGDRFLEAAGLNRDWPEDRGIYHNSEKTFLVWVNEEDQLRIISMEQGGDIASVFSRLAEAMNALDGKLSFLCDQRLGYLTSCPTNLGTAMRASFHVRLPKLARYGHLLRSLADRYQLQIRGVHGEHSEGEEGVYDISNRRRLGISEVDCIRDLTSGVTALINKERDI